MIYILQYQGTSLISRTIKAITWGRFSHSAIGNSDGWIVEAWEGSGVDHVPSPWRNHKSRTPISVYGLDTTPEIMKSIWTAAMEEVRNQYDYLSLLGFLPGLRALWKDDEYKWFCSHLVAHACKAGGAPLFSPVAPLYKISPSLIPYSPKLTWLYNMKTDLEWEVFLSQQRERCREQKSSNTNTTA